MHKWRRWSVGICLSVALIGPLVPGCARWMGQSSALHPVPPALDWPAFDAFRLADGAVEYSLLSEAAGTARLGDIWTRGAAAQRDAFWQRVLRDRCAAREALQIANGGKADPDPICKGAGEQGRSGATR